MSYETAIMRTVTARWPRTSDGTPVLRSRELSEEQCREVLGYISQGKYLRVIDPPPCYRGDSVEKLLKGVLVRDPEAFRGAVLAGCIQRRRDVIRYHGLTEEQAATDPFLEPTLKDIEEIREGKEDTIVNFGAIMVLGRRGTEISLYDNSFG